MIQELVEIWAWFFGMIAGWGATTIGIVITLVVLWIRHQHLKQQVNQLYARIVSHEREISLKLNRDRM